MPPTRHLLRALLLALALITTAPAARADSISLGGTYSGTFSMLVDGTPVAEGGGNIGGSSGVKGGVPFNFIGLYCVDQFTGASLNTTYTAHYNNTGTINSQVLPAAGQIAWLMLNIAPNISTQAQYQALQGLIWQLESPANGKIIQYNSAANSTAANTFFNTYLAQLGTKTAPVSGVHWINPVNAQGVYAYQGLVGVTQAQRDAVQTPEPASFALFGAGLAALAALRRRRQK